MKTLFNPMFRGRITIDEFIALTAWPVPGNAARVNMASAFGFFQENVRRDLLWSPENSPWLRKINGRGYKVVSWMQGICFELPVNPNRIFRKGDPLHSYRDPGEKLGNVRGNWFTFPSTDPDRLAIYPDQTRLHKFKAKSDFVCLQSAVSDAYCGWLPDRPPRYRHGGGQQLFIPNPALVLEALLG